MHIDHGHNFLVLLVNPFKRKNRDAHLNFERKTHLSRSKPV